MSAYEALSGCFGSLFTDLDPAAAMKFFKKKTYLPFLEKYKEEHGEVYSLILAMMEEEEDWEEKLKALAVSAAQDVKKELSKEIFFIRGRDEMDRTCSVTFYVLPALMDLSSEEAPKAAQTVGDAWSEVFTSTKCTAASKNEIQAGFKTRIFGVPVGW